MDNKNFSQVINHDNEKKFECKKIVDEDQDNNHEQGLDDFLHNTSQSIVAKLSILYFNDTIIFNVGLDISHHKSSVLGNLIDGLKKIGIAKNQQKKVYDAAM